MDTEIEEEKHLWVWDMDSTLKLTNNISGPVMTCVGPTRTGTRCHIKIPLDQHLRVKDVIRDLTKRSPRNTIPYLNELAKLSLCQNYHGTTAHLEDKEKEWEKDIELITRYCDWSASLSEQNQRLQETSNIAKDARLKAQRELKQRQEADQNAESMRAYQIDEHRAQMSSHIEAADKAKQDAELSLATAIEQIDLLRGELENEKQAVARLQQDFASNMEWANEVRQESELSLATTIQENASLKMNLDNEKQTSARLQEAMNSHTCPVSKYSSKSPPPPKMPAQPIRSLTNSISFDRKRECDLLNITCNELQQKMEVQEAAHLAEVQMLEAKLEQAESNITGLQQRVEEGMNTNLRLRSQISDSGILLADAGFADLVRKLASMSLEKLVDFETALRERVQTRVAASSQNDLNESDSLEQNRGKRRRIESA